MFPYIPFLTTCHSCLIGRFTTFNVNISDHVPFTALVLLRISGVWIRTGPIWEIRGETYIVDVDDVSLCCCLSAEREKTPCERHRESAQSSTSDSSFLSFFRPRPAVGQYVPQCDEHGSYQSTQCHTSIGQCWCVDASGQELPNTRTGPGNTPLCEYLPAHCLSAQGCCPRLPHLRDDLSSPQVSTRQWLLPRSARRRGLTSTPSLREHTCCSLRAGRSSTSLWTDTTSKRRRPNLCCTSP